MGGGRRRAVAEKKNCALASECARGKAVWRENCGRALALVARSHAVQKGKAVGTAERRRGERRCEGNMCEGTIQRRLKEISGGGGTSLESCIGAC